MRYAFKILSFGWRYLKNYRVRLALGLLCGFLYAALNGGAVWAVGELQERFSAKNDAPGTVVQTNAVVGLDHPGTTNYSETSTIEVGTNAVSAVEEPDQMDNVPALRSLRHTKLRSFTHKLDHAVDPWLPRIGGPVTWRHWVFLLLLMPLIIGVRGAMDYLSNYSLGWVGERAVRDMRIDVMEKMSHLSLDFFNRSHSGDLITRINMDTQNLLRTLRTAAPDLLKESISVLVVFVVLLRTDLKMTVGAIIIVPLCVIPVVFFGRKARKAMRAARAAGAMQTGQLVELIGGIRVIKAYNLEEAEIERFRKSSKEIVRADMKGVQAKESVGPLVEIVSMLGLGMLILYILYSPTSTRNLFSFFTAFLFFFQSVKKLSGVHILFEQTHISVDRIMDLLREEAKVTDPAQPRSLKTFQSEISLEGVSFGYLERQVLREASIHIPKGFKLGIAGESGSGKTTIVNLLFRFYDPTRGAIKIDGLDVREITMHDLRQQMALVSQDVVVFDQTAAENIAVGRLGATREEVEAAAKAAFAHDFIMQLPQGYETKVGERGVTLSGGQRQRLAIARAFVRNAPILVLDEATASLDSKAEGEVQMAIDRLAEHRTVICVAHRLSTLKDMDKILVLSEGQIVESGSFKELVRAGGAFAAMAARQGILLDVI